MQNVNTLNNEQKYPYSFFPAIKENFIYFLVSSEINEITWAMLFIVVKHFWKIIL